MKNWFIGKILSLIGKKLDGYKTKIGGVGLVLVGVTGIIAEIFPDQGLPKMGLESSFGSIAAGVAALGLGHKAEKTKAAVLSVGSIPEPPPADYVKRLRPEDEEAGPASSSPIAEPSSSKEWDGKVPGQFP